MANLIQGPNSPDHEPLTTQRTRPSCWHSSMFLRPPVVAAKARRHSPYSMSRCSYLSPGFPHNSTVNLRQFGARPGRDLERSSLHARSSLGTLPCPVDSKRSLRTTQTSLHIRQSYRRRVRTGTGPDYVIRPVVFVTEARHRKVPYLLFALWSYCCSRVHAVQTIHLRRCVC